MLKEFEGCVPWMYRDTVGKVTVGVGLMLPDAKTAQALPFLAGSEPATPSKSPPNSPALTPCLSAVLHPSTKPKPPSN